MISIQEFDAATHLYFDGRTNVINQFLLDSISHNATFVEVLNDVVNMVMVEQHPYSLLRELAGFAEAAFMDWYPMVSHEMINANAPAATYTMKPISTL